uniref:Uncharacterized protein n=1 Tax=Arion vulgaris TaxID=1028688 RepID=A0A0B6ZVJ7_9EUPU
MNILSVANQSVVGLFLGNNWYINDHMMFKLKCSDDDDDEEEVKLSHIYPQRIRFLMRISLLHLHRFAVPH